MRKKLIILFIGIGSFTLFAQQRDHRTREYIAPVRIVCLLYTSDAADE